MPQTVKGVISRSKGADVEVVDIVVPDPGPGEAVVKIETCGVCHTDLHYREGGINDDYPFLLGHEAAGYVEAVGEGVTDVAPGDFVILNWRAVCGQCRACAKGKPWYCFNTHNATQKMTLTDGTELTPGARHRRLHREDARRRRPVHEGPRGRRRRRRPARLRRHGRLRRGRQHRWRGPRRLGRRHRLRRRRQRRHRRRPGGRRDDDHRRRRQRRASSSRPSTSARRTPSTARTPTPVEAIRGLTGGNGADVVVEAVGRPETYEQAFYARDLAGTVVLVGVPTPDQQVTLPMIDIFGRGGALKSSWYGDCLPSRDFPMLVDLYKQGRFDLDAFVSERIGLGDIEAAFEKMHAGEVLRSVVEL